MLSPTSSSNCCFLGEPARGANLLERWLRVMRWDDGTAMVRVSSLRGSGEDMMSALGVAGFAMACQRTLKPWVAGGTGADFRRVDIGGET